MSGSNPYANPAILQPTNPLQTLGNLYSIQQQQNQLSLFPLIQQQEQIKTQANQLGLTQAQNGAAAAYSRYRLSQPSVSNADILSDIGQAKAAGLNVDGLTSDFTNASAQPGFNGKSWIQQHLLAGASVPETAQLAIGNPASINTGPSVQPGITGGVLSQSPGAFTPSGAGVGLGLSPEGYTAPTQIGTTPQGQPVIGTRGQFLAASGADPLGTGRPIPPGLRGPNAPPAGVVTGLGPAQTSAMSTTGAQSAQAFQGISDQGVRAQSQNALLGNMMSDLSQFTPGPTGVNNARAWIVRNAATLGTSFGIDPNKVAANESFDKLANQLADAQGAGSDARLAVNQHANPSSALSPAGVDQIIRMLQGNSDYLQARSQLASAYPDKSDVTGFNAKAQSINPEVFQYNRMNPAQKATFYNGLPNKSQFKKDYDFASGNGLIGAQNANQ